MPPADAEGGNPEAQLCQVLEETSATWAQVRDTLAGLRAQLATGSGHAPEAGRGLDVAAETKQREPELRLDASLQPGKHTDADRDGGIEGTAALAPKAKARNRRVSAFATSSLADAGELAGGRLVAIETNSPLLGELECVLIEPLGKQAAPDSFVSAGLLVCLQGMPSSRESLDEWNRASASAGWLNLGATVAVPNLQMNAALELQDLEAVLRGVLAKAGFGRCVLVGKDWGGTVAVELASRSSLAMQIDGLVLVAPDSPAPPHAHEVSAPVLLLWAHDDDVCSFDDRGTWFEALDDRTMPTTVRECETGAHRLDRILELEGVSSAVKNFTVSAFVLAELEEVEVSAMDSRAAECDDQSDEDERESMRGSRLERLRAELPAFLAAATTQLGQDEGRQAAAKRLSLSLPHWIHSGMAQASE